MGILIGFFGSAKPSPDYAVIALAIVLHGVMVCGEE
jgi:hypothetical protein